MPGPGKSLPHQQLMPPAAMQKFSKKKERKAKRWPIVGPVTGEESWWFQGHEGSNLMKAEEEPTQTTPSAAMEKEATAVKRQLFSPSQDAKCALFGQVGSLLGDSHSGYGSSHTTFLSTQNSLGEAWSHLLQSEASTMQEALTSRRTGSQCQHNAKSD